MQNKFVLYIGSNNSTGLVETDVIIKMLNKHFDGYTLQHAQGLWMGNVENSVIVTIITDKSHLLTKCITNDLRKSLNQTSIFLEFTHVLCTSIEAS